MRTNSPSELPGRVAFLWDESFLWGVMAYKALRAAKLPFELIRAEDIRKGSLEGCKALFVPGGWASNKAKALGEEGMEAIRQFVRQGGSYIGFCGGAGLATQDGIGLLPVTRRPTKDRVPSFSGPVRLNVSGHAIWQGIVDPVFHAWWPSQFIVDGDVSVLATYGDALPGSFSSDVNVGDARTAGRWTDLERTYGINLDPDRLRNEPAVLEGAFGAGKVLLSLVHFDTPDDRNGASVLKHIWSYLASHRGHPVRDSVMPHEAGAQRAAGSGNIYELTEAVDGLIELGFRNFLWFRRNPLLLQWRRGVRGLEYCTLQVMVNEIAGQLELTGKSADNVLRTQTERIRELLPSFVEKAKQLLIRERFALQSDHLTYERCDDPEIRSLRDELFSRSKSHGGKFKELLDAMDALLFSLMTDC